MPNNNTMGLLLASGQQSHRQYRLISLQLILSAYNNKTWCDQIMSNYTRGKGNGLCTPVAEEGTGGGKGITTEQMMISTVVLMAATGSTLFVDGLLRTFFPQLMTLKLRLFLGRYNLDPILRFVLNFAFVQFLPLLSTVLSRAESDGEPELDLIILLWMLLVELIRKKVQGMMLSKDGSSFSRGIGRFTLMDYSDEASRLAWIGYLMWSTLEKMTKRLRDRDFSPLYVMFLVLWLLGLVNLVQRVVNTWLASSSWYTAKNPILIAGYMQQVVEEEEDLDDNRPQSIPPLSRCKFVVMGEDKLVTTCVRPEEEEEKTKKLETHGYGYGVGRHVVPCHRDDPPYSDQNEQKHVDLLLVDTKKKQQQEEEETMLFTVGDIWRLHSVPECKKLFSGTRREPLEDLCLAFSLFKMLRRRFEHYPMVEVGSAMAREVMLDGLLDLRGTAARTRAVGYCGRREAAAASHHRPFRVLQLELSILTDYYQKAGALVVMSQPILFVSNFAFSIIFVLVFAAAILYILVLNNDAGVLYCVAMGLAPNPKDSNSNSTSPSFIHLAITLLLVLTVMAIETYEFWNLYVFSDWNIVRMVRHCYYDSRRNKVGRGCSSSLLRQLIGCVVSARFFAYSASPCLANADQIRIPQASILGAFGALDKYSSAMVTQKLLHVKAWERIIEALRHGVDRNTGVVRLPQLEGLRCCDGGSGGTCRATSTDIILACHLATELLLETTTTTTTAAAAVASALSKYCMYLVAHVPQLLPDEETWVAQRYEAMRSCLEEHVSCCSFLLTYDRRKAAHAKQFLQPHNKVALLNSPATHRGMHLFTVLKNKLEPSSSSRDSVWADLARFWVGLLVYLAPSNDVQGHAMALATWGAGDLITCLWALCTHAGITRHPQLHLPPPSRTADDDDHGIIAIAATMV